MMNNPHPQTPTMGVGSEKVSSLMSEVDPKLKLMVDSMVWEGMESDIPVLMFDTSEMEFSIRCDSLEEAEGIRDELRELWREKIEAYVQERVTAPSNLAKIYEQLKRRGGLWLCDDNGNRVLYSNIQEAVDVLMGESSAAAISKCLCGEPYPPECRQIGYYFAYVVECPNCGRGRDKPFSDSRAAAITQWNQRIQEEAATLTLSESMEDGA